MKHSISFPSVRTISMPFLAALVAGLLLSSLAQAAPLTEDQIQAFINTMNDTEELRAEFELAPRDAERKEDLIQPLTSSLDELENHPKLRDGLKDSAQKHGFESLRQFAEVGDRILLAVMAINFRNMPAEDREMMEAMAYPGAGTGLSDTQKAEMKEMAELTQATMRAAESAPEEDQEAVRPYLDQVEAVDEE